MARCSRRSTTRLGIPALPGSAIHLDQSLYVIAQCLTGAQQGPKILARRRSEEHTSELQSRLHLVCRLLLEKKNALEIAHGDIEQIADAAGQALEEPHVRTGRSQFDMAEAFAADLGQSDFDAALIANDAPMLHALVLAAKAPPIGDGAKNFGAEETVTLGLEGAVIDGLGLGDFTVRPGANFFRTRQRDADGIEICDQAGAIIRAAAIQGCFLPP